MALRLPDETALGRAPGIRVDRRIPPAVTPAFEQVAPTLERIGEKIGGVLEKRENDQEAFDTQARYIDFQDQQSKALMDSQRSAAPGADGFQQTTRDAYQKAARDFFKTVPERLQAETDVRLRSFEARVTDAAQRFEIEEGRRHAVSTVDQKADQLAIRANQDPAGSTAALGEIDGLIDASPKLSKPEKDELKLKVRSKITMAGQQGLIDSDPDAAKAWQDSQYGGAYAAKVGKSESAGNYDPASTPTSRSTDGRGKYGFLRSGFVPLAREADPQATAGKSDDEVWAMARGRENAALQERVFGLLTRKNEGALKAAGIPITDTTRYLAHWFGAKGATDILKASPDTPIENFLPNAKGADGVMRSPADWAKVNGVQGKTVREVVQIAQQRMNESASTVPGSPTVPTEGRKFVVPEGISYEQFQALRGYGERRIKQLQSDATENAQVVEQDVLLGRRDPSELTGVASTYRRLGMNAQANYADYLASKPDMIQKWVSAGSDEQRALLLRAKDPIAAAGTASLEEDKRQRTELVKAGESRLKLVEDDLKARAPLDQVMPRLQEVWSIAQQTKHPELMQKVQQIASQYQATEALRSMPTAVSDAALERARNQMARDGAEPGQYALVGRLEEEHRKYVEGLSKDAWSSATDRFNLQVQQMPDIRAPAPSTIDALRTRAAQAQAIAAKEPAYAAKVVPFSSEEMAAIGAAFDKAPANQKVQMLGTLSAGLGPEWFAATMKHMAEKGHNALAWAGGLMSTDAPAARTILEGQEVRKQTPKTVPQGAELTTALDDKLGTLFRDSPAGRAMVNDAVQAAYAKLAFDQGKTDGKFDADIAEKAMRLVLGNVPTYRGQQIFPPRRDMTSSDVSEVVARLQDTDLPDLRTVERDKIDAARIKAFGVLTSAGDGRYTVELRDRGGVLHKIGDPANPAQPWILDLRPLLARGPEPTRRPDTAPPKQGATAPVPQIDVPEGVVDRPPGAGFRPLAPRKPVQR